MRTTAEAIAAERTYLVRYLQRLLANREQAEDVAQSALVDALECAREFEGRASLRSWLVAIARNRMIDLLRQRRREPLAADLGVAAHGVVPSSESLAFGAQLARLLALEIARLPERSGRALAHRLLDRRPTAQILRDLDASAAEYARLVHRARSRLRARLADLLPPQHLNWETP